MITTKYREGLIETAILIQDLAAEAEIDYSDCAEAVNSALASERKDEARAASAEFVRARKRWAGLMAAQAEIGYSHSEVEE